MKKVSTRRLIGGQMVRQMGYAALSEAVRRVLTDLEEAQVDPTTVDLRIFRDIDLETQTRLDYLTVRAAGLAPRGGDDEEGGH